MFTRPALNVLESIVLAVYKVKEKKFKKLLKV